MLRVHEWEERRCGGRNAVGVGMGVVGPVADFGNYRSWR